MKLRVEPLDDPNAVDALLRDAWIAPKLRRDDRAAAYVDHPLLTYHGAYVDDRLVGLFMAVRFTAYETEVHVAIKREAVAHGRALSHLFLEQVFADPFVLRATAYVIGTLGTAANMVRKLGFTDEGRRRHACLVRGEPTDIIILGLTREDWTASASAEAASLTGEAKIACVERS